MFVCLSVSESIKHRAICAQGSGRTASYAGGGGSGPGAMAGAPLTMSLSVGQPVCPLLSPQVSPSNTKVVVHRVVDARAGMRKVVVSHLHERQ